MIGPGNNFNSSLAPNTMDQLLIEFFYLELLSPILSQFAILMNKN